MSPTLPERALSLPSRCTGLPSCGVLPQSPRYRKAATIRPVSGSPGTPYTAAGIPADTGPVTTDSRYKPAGDFCGANIDCGAMPVTFWTVDSSMLPPGKQPATVTPT